LHVGFKHFFFFFAFLFLTWPFFSLGFHVFSQFCPSSQLSISLRNFFPSLFWIFPPFKCRFSLNFHLIRIFFFLFPRL
jgi:hypothetical protein